MNGQEALTNAIAHAERASRLLESRPALIGAAHAHAAASRAWSAIASELVYVEIQHPEVTT